MYFGTSNILGQLTFLRYCVSHPGILVCLSYVMFLIYALLDLIDLFSFLFFKDFSYSRKCIHKQGEQPAEGEKGAQCQVWSHNPGIMMWADSTHLPDRTIQVSLFFLSVFIYLSNFYTQHGTYTHYLKIKSHMLFWQSQPGAPNLEVNLKSVLREIEEWPHSFKQMILFCQCSMMI